MMNAVFEGLNFVQKVVMVLEIAGIIIVFLYVLYRILAGKKLMVDIRRGKMNYSPDDTDSKNIQTVGTGVFIQTLEAVAMMTHIKTKMILHDQMTYLEERLVVIRDAIQGAYRHKLGELLSDQKGVVTVSSTQDYLFFVSLVGLMKEEMKSGLRVFFLRNHFSSFSEEELKLYIAEKNEITLIKAYQFLRDMYPSEKMVVPFEQVEKALDTVKKDLEYELENVFKKAVKIYHERLDQIQAIETGLRSRIMDTYGVDLSGSAIKVFNNTLNANGGPNA